jgi:nitrate/nitrite-specific signal transduction histidine kinase
VTDDGVGFDVPNGPADFAPTGYYGLLRMYERSELIGATLKIQSSPGTGTHLIMILPIQSAKINYIRRTKTSPQYIINDQIRGE